MSAPSLLRRLAALSCLLLTACTSASASPSPTPMPEFRIIGYATAASVPEIIPYNKLTHINYAFLIPNVDGAFEPPPNLWKLERIVELAHQSGTRVLISVGGWGWDAEFERLAASPRARAALVEGLVSFVEQYSLDGVDMDWEYPDPGESAANFLALMSELRAALPEGKLLTAAVIAYGDEYGMGVPADAIPLLDFINLMAYDGDDHGTMSQSEQALDYWLGRGFASSQVVLGVPFYARPSETPYRKIVEQDPAAAQLDEFDYFGVMIHYNGIPTIQEKTRLALARGSGIMFWTLDHDIQGEFSLVEAIYQAAHAP